MTGPAPLKPPGGWCRLRPATTEDVVVLEAWDTQPHVIAASGRDDTFDWRAEVGRAVPWREILLAEAEDGRPVGVVVIIDPAEEETHYWGDTAPNLRAIDVWIGEEADLGRGYGTAMMTQAIGGCFADPAVTAILIDPLASNARAIRFYQRLGFRPVEPRRFGDDHCLVLRLDRGDWRSPAARSAGLIQPEPDYPTK